MKPGALNVHESGASEPLVQVVLDHIRGMLEQEYRERELVLARRMYRKGYSAGHSAARRGAPCVTNPERRTRGADRELLNDR